MTNDERSLLCAMADLIVIIAGGKDANIYTKEIRRLVDKIASMLETE
jgi:hypothetical protein